MTEAMKVPTREQWKAAEVHLHRTSVHAQWFLYEEPEATSHEKLALEQFLQAASALGLRLSADEPAQQQPQSDLVARLLDIHKHDWRISFLAHTSDTAKEAADRIEALEAAAAQPSREAALVKALAEMIYETTHLSPRQDDGSHKCTISAAALAKARDAIRPYTPAYDTPATPDAGRPTETCVYPHCSCDVGIHAINSEPVCPKGYQFNAKRGAPDAGREEAK